MFEATLKEVIERELLRIEEQLRDGGESLFAPACRWSRESQVYHLKGCIDGLAVVMDSTICDLNDPDWFELHGRYQYAFDRCWELLKEVCNAVG